MKRKEFLLAAAPAFLLLANGQVLKASGIFDTNRKKKKLRFVVASDGHYGQTGTDYENYFATVVNRINEEHRKEAFDFCMINGDIIHDNINHLPAAKAALDKLQMTYYVTQGNHDHASPQLWEQTWGMPLNFDFTIKDSAFIAATTSNEAGKYLSPDINWMKDRLEAYKTKRNVFIFIHINQAKLTTHGINSPDFLHLASQYKNIRCIFNGHDHDEEGIKKWQHLQFVFDAHFGGNWGTGYRGFRVVELLKNNSVLSYIMNPFERINSTML
ncbi:MAG: metallophosphoesterase family protein [Niabella sp.]